MGWCKASSKEEEVSDNDQTQGVVAVGNLSKTIENFSEGMLRLVRAGLTG